MKSYPLNTFDKHSEVRHCERTTDCSHKWTDIHNILSWKTDQLKLCFTIIDIYSITIYFHLKLPRFWQLRKILMLDLFMKAYSCRVVFISTMKAIKFLSPTAAQQLLSTRGRAAAGAGRSPTPRRYPQLQAALVPALRCRAPTLIPKTKHPKGQLLIHMHPTSK